MRAASSRVQAKGVSYEDKRKRILEIFHETKDVFQHKDVERLAKGKGVIMQAVKDVLQNLVDDGLVMCEKIGSSNYYWSFPATAAKAKAKMLDDLRAQSQALEAHDAQLDAALTEARASREETDERVQLTAELAQLEADVAAMEKELEAYRDCDPEVFKDTLRQVDECRAAVNRWTDNIYAVQGYVRDKFGYDTSTFNKSFEIPDDLDYV
ncbi:Meiotic nuclear division protein 1 [Blastocladiella emersonii ATCC 22665]|nr:Meiotic nuclear division protein 1 [Blastocladiella emersonii ATCC 22665]